MAGVSGIIAQIPAIFIQAGQLPADTGNALTTTAVGVGAAGLLTALSGLISQFFKDRQAHRESQERMELERLKLQAHRGVVREIYRWVCAAKRAVPALPDPPEWFDNDSDQDRGKRK